MKRILIAAGLSAGFFTLGCVPAKADLQLCNHTASKIQAAVGYKDKDGWVTEGWWSANPQACMKLVQGSLKARYYYIYAIDRQKGGSWGGKALFCMKEKIFTIRGTNDCVGRGFKQQGFYEVDTGERADWTVSLSDPADQTSIAPANSGDTQQRPLPPPDAVPAPANNNPPQGQ